MIILFIAGISLMAALSLNAVAILGVYIALNIGYSFRLKHIAIVDVVIIAIGFVLRLFIGSIVTGVPLSEWIIIMTFLLALFLALAKRRDGFLIFLDTGNKMSEALDGYNIRLIDGAMQVMASVVIVAYILYTTSPKVIEQMQTENTYLTAFFVIVGIMRYLQITYVKEESGAPTNIVLRDKFMQITILAWLLTFAWIIYL